MGPSGIEPETDGLAVQYPVNRHFSGVTGAVDDQHHFTV